MKINKQIVLIIILGLLILTGSGCEPIQINSFGNKNTLPEYNPPKIDIPKTDSLPSPWSIISEVEKSLNPGFKINYQGLDSLIASGEDINKVYKDTEAQGSSVFRNRILKSVFKKAGSSGAILYSSITVVVDAYASHNKSGDATDNEERLFLIEYLFSRGVNPQDTEAIRVLRNMIEMSNNDETNPEKIVILMEVYKKYGFKPEEQLDLSLSEGHWPTIKALYDAGVDKNLSMFIFDPDRFYSLKKIRTLIKHKDEVPDINYDYSTIQDKDFLDAYDGPEMIEAFKTLGISDEELQRIMETESKDKVMLKEMLDDLENNSDL